MSDHVMPTYRRLPLNFVRGTGSWLETDSGERYLDFGSGVAVNTLGHAHPKLTAALVEQAEKLWHVSNLYSIQGQERLADRLCDASFADRVFFCNSGTEAIEGVIKTIRKYHAAAGNPQRYKIITFGGAFHGRTYGALAATGNAAYLDGFGPQLPGFVKIEPLDLKAVAAAIDDETAGILIEPVQGEGGARSVGAAFLRGLRSLADQHGLLLAFDEVQCGIGRTGALFAHQLFGIDPDIMAIAKGLGGGFPIGAFLASEAAAGGMVAGSHGSTFGGNPLATAVANAVLDEVLHPDFLPAVQQKSALMRQGLAAVCDAHPQVLDGVRGEGLLIGVHCVVPNTDFVDALRAQGLLSVAAGDNTVRLLPPLNVKQSELETALRAVELACTASV